jgi:hypothetical protein
MRRAKVRTQAAKRADRRPDVDAGLRELLNHLGRLLAQEYVKTLAGKVADKLAPRSEERR